MFDVLVVEDDEKLLKIISIILDRNGYSVTAAENGKIAFEEFEKKRFDLVISDIMMPVMDGCELTESIRKISDTIPILMITAKGDYEDKKRGFYAGTDDYMVKPIDVNELLLRVKALLRRSKIADEHRLILGSTKLDFDSYTAYYKDRGLELPQKEFLLLFKLLSYPNKIFTRQQLMDDIWGYESETEERTVDVHINRLRDRVGKWEDFEIVTIRGLGYKAVIKAEQ